MLLLHPVLTLIKTSNMLLRDIPLTDPIDKAQLDAARENYRTLLSHGKVEDGRVSTGVNLLGGEIFVVTTKDEQEFVLFNVFLAKIRRDDVGLAEAPVQAQRAWCEMASQFKREFGNDRTPPDVLEELAAVKDHLGL